MDKSKPKCELTVIVKAKELCKYVMTVTQKSPKQFRFTFTGRLQNLTLDVLECLFRANDTFVEKGDREAMRVRSGFMHTAMTHLKILAYFAMLADV